MEPPKKEGNKEDDTVTCHVCGDVMMKDHIGIICTQSHHLCTECCPAYVRTIMEDPEALVPPKCTTCKCEVILETFERQLDAPQHSLYLSHLAMKTIEEGTKLMGCPFCSYFEIWPLELTGMDFLFCRKQSCQKSTCAHCKIECDRNEDGGVEDEGYDAACRNSSNFLYHMECAELARYKQQFERAIEQGMGIACPSCGHFGRKDDECTHITCMKCQVRFCYVCGLSSAEADKSDPNGSIYHHNDDWDINPLRCPMYLTQISEVDDRWSEDDKECVAFASRIKTLRNLRAARENMGSAMFDRLLQKYDSVRNCGFTMTEITDSDVTLIYRTDVTGGGGA